MQPLFSVCEYTTYPLSFEREIELYSRLKIDGIELCEEKLSDDHGLRREQLAMLRDSGLILSSVQPAMLSVFPHILDQGKAPDDPRERSARYRQTIDLIAEHFPGQAIPLVAGGGIAPGQNFREAHAVARRQYRELADYAAQFGIRLMLEPLSPNHMNIFAFLCTLDAALRVIEDVDRPNFGLCLDVWHIWREERIAERISALRDQIFAVHLSDWPAEEPRCLDDRLLPGDGIIPLPELLGAIEATEYNGHYCLEIFSASHLNDSLWNQDFEQVLRRGRDGFMRAWNMRQPVGQAFAERM